jgi:hypothetical protein
MKTARMNGTLKIRRLKSPLRRSYTTKVRYTYHSGMEKEDNINIIAT